ncbi:MAG: hypothetical protein HY658_09555 [Actinobacteria bacterium]|nr:hypothetical protein [Actinomycetota bacterium]
MNATLIVELRNKIDKDLLALEALPGISEQIRALNKFVDDPRVKGRERWTEERLALDGVAEQLESLKVDISDNPYVFEAATVVAADDSVNPDLMERLTALQSDIAKTVEADNRATLTHLAARTRRLATIEKEWKQRDAIAQEEYEALLSKLDATVTGQAAVQDQLTTLRRRQKRLQDVETRLSTKEKPKLGALEKRREELLDSLLTARSEMSALRRAKAKQLQQRLQRKILIDVRSGALKDEYVNALKALAVGSFLHATDIETIASVHPISLAKGLLSGELGDLAEASGVSEVLFRKLADIIGAKDRFPQLYEMQVVDTHDDVSIRFVGDTGKPKPLSALAHGQKCTVILMIALAEGTFPFIVDQPEDALHAPWIEQNIVVALRKQRGQRQCVFATRSANVLVSADAEQVIAMTSTADAGRVEKTGAIDRFDTRELVLYHVEGGKQPFLRRQRMYRLEGTLR